ncbi:MAG: HU family DNA-binding protein [Clostridia bacterium]|nr:HU family DNA-binding protein [Clostridia bacterium]
MNKAELIDKASAAAGVSKKETGEVLTAILGEMAAALSRGERVTLVGFGSFEVKDKAARMGFNPATMEEMEIPASRTIAFKPGKNLKESL